MQRYTLGVIFLLLVLVTACRKYVTIPEPPDQVLRDQVFTTDIKATSAVTAIYGNMINGSQAFSNFLTTVYAGMSSDELLRYNPSLLFQEFMNNQLTATNGQVKNIWSTAYRTIYYTNVALEGIAASTGMTAALKMQLTGECKFVRAFTYFYLVNLYGDVPLITTTDYQANTNIARSPAATVYDLMTADLLDAIQKLGDTYPSNEKVRPNRWAATALLARVYLYSKEWAKAEALSAAVINSGLFTPLPPPQNVFLKNSKEAIWQLLPANGFMQEIRQMRPSGTTPQVYLRSGLVNLFEPVDQRRQKWFDSVTFQAQKYYYPGKYKNTTTTVNEYYMVLRAAEQYLIRAEARAQQNNLAGALGDVNVIRARAGLPPVVSFGSVTQALAAVDKERQTELFAEWGHRWLDLKRTETAAAVLGPLKTGFQLPDLLFPIPQDDLNSNNLLTQNPGY